jgi:hypothetical protein
MGERVMKKYLDMISSRKVLFSRGMAWFNKLSKREKLLVGVPIPIILFFILHAAIYTPVMEAFASQNARLEESTANIKIIAAMLEKYQRLKSRRANIEEQYKEIEIKESGITLLENMISKHLELPSKSFDIRPSDPQEFGGNFEKTSYTIKFSTPELGKLVAFLDELVHGQAPMILRRLDLKVSGSNSLDVEIDASSIRRISG